MTIVTVKPGVCGLNTIIEAESDDFQTAALKITSECPHYKNLGIELTEVDAFEECFAKVGEGRIYKICAAHCKHAACPVPCGIVKAVEAACGLALPRDVTIEFQK